jgi:hypothetical protein
MLLGKGLHGAPRESRVSMKPGELQIGRNADSSPG